MKFRLLSLASVVLTLILAVLLIPESTANLTGQVRILFEINMWITDHLYYITLLILLTSFCISSYKIFFLKKMKHISCYFIFSTIIIYIAFQFLAYILLKVSFLSSPTLDILMIEKTLSDFNLPPNIWSRLQQFDGVFAWIQGIKSLGTQNILLLFLLAFVFSATMLKDKEEAEPFYNINDSVSRLTFTFFCKIFTFLSVYLIFLSIFRVIEIQSNTLIWYYSLVITQLFIFTLILLFLIPIFLWIFYRDKSGFYFLSNTFLSILSSFISGNAILGLAVMTVEQKTQQHFLRNITGFLNPLNYLFLRPGTAIVIGYFFIFYYSSVTRWELDFLPELQWLILMPIVFSILIGVFSIPYFYMILPFYFILFGLSTIGDFVLITPVILIGQSFAACIDVISWNLSNYIYSKFYSDGID